MPQASHLSATDLQTKLAAGVSLVLLDIREDFERDINRIPTTGADHHIPMGEIPTRLAEVVELTASCPVVIYCHHGVRSMTVVRWLAARGVTNLVNLDGGIDAYSKVDPTVPRY